MTAALASLELADRLLEIDQVEQVDVVTGSADLMVRLRFRDADHLNDVLFRSLLGSSERSGTPRRS